MEKINIMGEKNMAFRLIYTEFWEDAKVMEEMTPEDKYFYLYLLTNPHTNMIGIYQILKKQMAFELGYSIESINSLMYRFEEYHKLIKYDAANREILIKNFVKYNLRKGGKPIEDCIKKELKTIKNIEFVKEIIDNIPNEGIKKLVFSTVYGDTYDTCDDTCDDTLDDTCNDTSNDTPTYQNQNQNQNQNHNLILYMSEIWANYPKKKGKAVAIKKIEKLLKTYTKDQIIEWIERYKKEFNGDYTYMVHGSTFFNSTYVDYMDENYISTTVKPKKETEPKANIFSEEFLNKLGSEFI